MFKYQNWRRLEIPKYFRWPVSPSRKLRRVPSPWVSSSTVAAALISRLEMGSRFISPWNTRYIQVPDTGQLCSAPFNHGSLPTSRYFKIFQEKCGPSNSGSNCGSKSNRLVLPNLRLAIQHQDIREAVDYGVIKMNIDTDTQCPTRSVLLGSWAKMRMSRIQLHKWEILPWHRTCFQWHQWYWQQFQPGVLGPMTVKLSLSASGDIYPTKSPRKSAILPPQNQNHNYAWWSTTIPWF